MEENIKDTKKAQYESLASSALVVILGKDEDKKKENMEKKILKAIREINLYALKILFQSGEDLNAKLDHLGYNALIIASQKGYFKILKFLVKNDADPNAKTHNGATGLILASQKGHFNVVKLLIENGADPNLKSDNGWTALMLASQEERNFEIVKFLIKNGADPNAKRNNGMTAFILASRSEDSENAKFLVETGADPNVKQNGWNLTPGFCTKVYSNSRELQKLAQNQSSTPTTGWSEVLNLLTKPKTEPANPSINDRLLNIEHQLRNQGPTNEITGTQHVMKPT